MPLIGTIISIALSTILAAYIAGKLYHDGSEPDWRRVSFPEGKLTAPGRTPNVLSRFRFGHCVPATDRR
jgi:hypothetical protein